MKVLSESLQYLLEGDVPKGEQTKASFASWHSVILDIDEFDDPTSIDVFYSRALLMDVRSRVGKLDSTSFLTVRSLAFPPPVIEKVVTALLPLFVEDAGHLNDWNTCKHYLSTHLIKLIVVFDPTTPENAEALLAVEENISQLSFDKVRLGKFPHVLTLYMWLLVAINLARSADTFSRRRPKLHIRRMSRLVSDNPPKAFTPVEAPIQEEEVPASEPAVPAADEPNVLEIHQEDSAAASLDEPEVGEPDASDSAQPE